MTRMVRPTSRTQLAAVLLPGIRVWPRARSRGSLSRRLELAEGIVRAEGLGCVCAAEHMERSLRSAGISTSQPLSPALLRQTQHRLLTTACHHCLFSQPFPGFPLGCTPLDPSNFSSTIHHGHGLTLRVVRSAWQPRRRRQPRLVCGRRATEAQIRRQRTQIRTPLHTISDLHISGLVAFN